MNHKVVLLSFDIEEFDMPLEYHYPIPFDEQIRVSKEGTLIILALLKKFGIKATFFCTYTFAAENKSLIQELCTDGHELASHGYYHSKFEESDLLTSREQLETLSGKTVYGFRMPRMKSVNPIAIVNAGYQYDSSLNPVYIPGRYNNLHKPRTIYKQNDLWVIPVSSTKRFRIPLFWLSFHHFPIWLYKFLVRSTLSNDKYMALYFHPWEFIDLKNKYGLTYLTTHNTGDLMMKKFEQLLEWMIQQRYTFSTMNNFIQAHNPEVRT